MNMLNQLKNNKQMNMICCSLEPLYSIFHYKNTHQHHNIEHTYCINDYNSNLLVAITPSIRPNERKNAHKTRAITMHILMSRDLKTTQIRPLYHTAHTKLYPNEHSFNKECPSEQRSLSSIY